MKRQRNVSQMKEQNKNHRKELSEMEISNLPNKGFKIVITEIGTSEKSR